MKLLNWRVILLLSGFVVFFWCSCSSDDSPKMVIYNSVGKTIVNNTGIVDFGICSIEDLTEKTFSITNISNKKLELTGNPNVEITGEDADQFIVSQQPDQMIAAGIRSLFKIQFKPTIVKQCNAVVSIKNNDKNNTPYTFEISGKSTKAYFDFNGDGYHDVIVGAYRDDDGGNGSGCAFIFFGSLNPSSLIDASNADVKFVGIPDDHRFGKSVSNAGDVNNDGYDDVIIGSDRNAFMFFGSSSPASTIIASNADVRLIEEDKLDAFGYSVSSAGDMNGDGFDDVIVGAPGDSEGASEAGSAFVFFGSSNLPSTIDAANADVRLVGEDISGVLGYSVCTAGDVNNDGFADVIVSAPWADPSGNDLGYVYILYGNSNLPKRIIASNTDVIISGENRADKFGYCVSYAGDVNGDGLDDVLVGSRLNNDGDNLSGCVYIFYGSSTLPSLINASNADVKLTSEVEDDYFGWCVSNAGDINDDGFDDFIIGAMNDIVGSSHLGCAYVFFGSSNLSAQIKASNANIEVIGESFTYYHFGYSVGCAGDMNKDGICDFIVGSPYDDEGGENSGAAFIYFGKQTWTTPVVSADADVKLVGEDAEDHFGCAVGGN